MVNINDFEETASNSIYLKLKYYKELIDVLGIEDSLKFNYDKDNKKFGDKIDDKDVLNNLDKVKTLFNIRGNKYSELDKEGGYGRLYRMIIGICRQLFGYDIINTKIHRVIKDNKMLAIRKYYLNVVYYNSISKYICKDNDFLFIDDEI